MMVVMVAKVWHIGAPAPHCRPASQKPARQNWTKLEEIDPNWSKLGLMRVTVSYRCLLLDEAGAQTCEVVDEVGRVVWGAGAHHHPQPH